PGPEGARLLHQRHRAETLPLLDRPVAYYDAGVGVVHATVAPVERPSGASPEARLITTLPVDLAVAPDGMIAVADPPGGFQEIASGAYGPDSEAHIVFGAGAVAVAWRGRDLVGFMREPAALWVVRPSLGHGPATTLATITLSTGSVADTGHALFHEAAAAGITCASCHPEGGEDGHVWRFEAFGPRRTQSLRGGLSQRAPFHWSGDLADVAALMAEVFVRRMGGRGFGESPSEGEIAALTDWLDTVPHLPTAALDPEAAARGRRVFEAIGCDECHFADGTVDPDSHDVGTGEPLQVPSLIGVGHRLPLMHDGCAATLADRFRPACGGANHGATADLAPRDQADLVAYLKSL
ncbi:MAG: cytochrome-c peroxidase, partial [Myxococcales bacterium]|nr:cytochrome-c peroxidase [Myxococcales bacterium]